MQKLTTSELFDIIRELENSAMDFERLILKFENDFEAKEFLKLQAKNLRSIAEKFRIAIRNEEKRIAIMHCYK